MKYSLLAAALATLVFTGCDQMREKTPGEGKPGQYPPSLWEGREGMPTDAEIEAAQKEADAEAQSKKERVEDVPADKAFNKPDMDAKPLQLD
jgi:hypothetical protein